MSKKLIPAVGYLRKSTKGEKADGKQKQEKSIPQQKEEIEKLAKGKHRIIGWFTDEGVSGWKRGAKRPDFQKMLATVQELGAQAILCDNIDRFSRAAFGEVQEDANTLCKAGVRWIVTASHGEYDLGAKHEIGDILKFVIAVWSSCEYSRQLGRRITLARRNNAVEGKRSGGPVPYGWKADGKHNLVHGDPDHVKVVRWIFDAFANKGESFNWIAEQLNHVKKIPSPRNGKGWTVRTVKTLLQNPVYIGEFQFGKQCAGQFYTLDEKGEVIPREDANSPGKVYREKKYKPMVTAEVFAKAQRRIDNKTTIRTERNRNHALAGILFYGGCGRPLYGTTIRGKYVVYRCAGSNELSGGKCQQWGVKERLKNNLVV